MSSLYQDPFNPGLSGGANPFDYSRIQSNPGETPDQTFNRYQTDYHADDRDSVLQAFKPWIAAGGQAPTAAASQAAPADYGSPQGQLSQVSQWLQAGGFGGDDPNYWVGRINATGGFTPQNLQYWQARIAAGPQGGQPGGAYYDPGAAGGAGGAGSSAGGSDPSGFQTQTRQALLDRIGQLQQPIDQNSASLTAPLGAYNTASSRGLQDTRDALAEQAYANGTLHTGGYDQSQQRAVEDAGAAKATFTGNLVNTADQQRQQYLNQLLGLGSGQALQEETAGGQLGFNYAQLQASMNRDAILAALSNYGG